MANRSTFPTQIDQFIENTEIQASDMLPLKRYQELKLMQSRTPAEDDELALLTQQLRPKLMLSEDYNHMKDSIKNVQTFFRDSVDGYIQTKQVEFQDELDKFNHKGIYNPTIQYYKKNTVTHNGETYIALIDTKNIAPNPTQDTANWAKIAQRGAKGEAGVAGTGLKWRGAWSAIRQYYKDDAVQFGGQIYAALQDVISHEPSLGQDTAYWALAVSKGQSTIISTLKNTTVINNVTENVSIGVLDYNNALDTLLVFKNSSTLAEDVNYKINVDGMSIGSLEGTWDGTEYPITFHFVVFKNTAIDMNYADGNLLQDASVGKHKLKLDLQNEIDAKETTASVDNKIGVLQDEIDVHKVDYVKHLADGGITAGTATAYTCGSSPNPSALVDKIGLMITAHVDSGANPTLKWGTNGVKPILKPNGKYANLKKDGLYTLRYNSVNDSFILQGEGGEDLTDLIALTNEAEKNEDAIRSAIASAVTAKGVPTANNAPWATINNNIQDIDQNPPMGDNGTSSITLNSGTTYYTMNVSNLGFRPTFVIVSWTQGNDLRRAQSFTSPATQISTIMGAQGFVSQAYISEIIPNDDGCQIALTASVSSAANGQVWSFNWWAYR